MVAKARRFLHIGAAGLLHYSGLLGLWRFVRRSILRKTEVCVIGFHRVLTEAERARSNSLDALVLRHATFVRVLEYVRRRFHVVSLEAFLSGEATGAETSKPCCLLTFDDGWRDTYSTAYPCLRKFAIPATVFLTSGLIEARGGFWAERLRRAWRDSSARAQIQSLLDRDVQKQGQVASLEHIIEWLKHMPAEERRLVLERWPLSEDNCDGPDEPDQMLTWNQVMEMSRDGIEFGTHTVSHPLLTYENAATVERELRLSKQVLEEKLHRKARAFAYPNGEWDERVRRWVEQVGYECAFTTRPGWYQRGQNPYTIPRILLHEGNVTGPNGQFSPAMLSLTLAGWH